MHSRTSARAQSLIWHAPDPTAVGVVCHATAVAGLALIKLNLLKQTLAHLG